MIAVNGILRSAGANTILTYLAVGEALINDGSALILYELFYHLVAVHQSHVLHVEDVIIYFVKVVVISPLIGLAMGLVSIVLIGLANVKSKEGDTTIQLGVTFCCAYFSFYIAQRMLMVSGVIACCTAGVLLSRYAVPRYLRADTIESVWSAVEWIGNTLLFFLAGLIIGNFAILKVEAIDLLYILIVYLFLLAVRYAATLTVYPALSWTTKGKFTFDGMVFVGWCGYRGASSFALSVALYQRTLDEKTDIPVKDIEKLIFLVGGIVFLSLLINATSSKWVLQKLHLLEDDLSTTNVSSFQRDHFRNQLAKLNVNSKQGSNEKKPVVPQSFNRETKLMFEYLKKKIRLKAYNLIDQAQNHYLSAYIDLPFIFRHLSLLKNSPEAKLLVPNIDDPAGGNSGKSGLSSSVSNFEQDGDFSEDEQEEDESPDGDQDEDDNMSTKENISKLDFKLINQEIEELERKAKARKEKAERKRKNSKEDSTTAFPSVAEKLEVEPLPIRPPALTLPQQTEPESTSYDKFVGNRYAKLKVQHQSTTYFPDVSDLVPVRDRKASFATMAEEKLMKLATQMPKPPTPKPQTPGSSGRQRKLSREDSKTETPSSSRRKGSVQRDDSVSHLNMIVEEDEEASRKYPQAADTAEKEGGRNSLGKIEENEAGEEEKIDAKAAGQTEGEDDTSNKISIKNIFTDPNDLTSYENVKQAEENNTIDLQTRRLSYRMLHNIIYPNLLLTMRKVFLEVLRVNYFKQINSDKLPRKSFAAIILLNSIDISSNATITPDDKLNDLMIILNSHYYLKKLYQGKPKDEEIPDVDTDRPASHKHALLHNRSHFHNDYSVHLQTAVMVLIAYIEAHEFAQSRIAFYLGEHDGIDTPEEDIVINESRNFVLLAKKILLTIHEPILRYIYSKRIISSILSLQQNLVFEFQVEGIVNVKYAEILFHEIERDTNSLARFERKKVLHHHPHHVHHHHHHEQHEHREPDLQQHFDFMQQHQQSPNNPLPLKLQIRNNYYLFLYYSEYYFEEFINWFYLIRDKYFDREG